MEFAKILCNPNSNILEKGKIFDGKNEELKNLKKNIIEIKI